MSKLEKISERCLAVCQVPKAISADAVRNYVESRFVNGRISDIDAVDGIESRNDQTRLVLLCTSVQDVNYMCQKVKEEAIHIGENQFTVRYQKAIACELPDKWENMEIPEEDNRQPGVTDSQVQGPQQPHAAPVPPHLRPMQQHPAEIGQQARPSFPWPYGPYGPMSGPYHNIPLNAQGAPDQMQGGGDQRLNQGGMPMQMPMYGGAPGQPPGQGNEHQPGLAPRIPHGIGHNRPPGPQQFGQQNQHFPYGQIPPGFNMFRMPQGFQSDPNNAQGGQNMPYHSGMRMPMPMFFDPNTGQMIPAPGFPNVQPHPAQVGGGPRGPHPPQHRAPPPPYNGAKFKGQDEDYTTEIKSPVDRADSERARQSQAVADQAEELQKLQTKVHREIQAESTDYEGWGCRFTSEFRTTHFNMAEGGNQPSIQDGSDADIEFPCTPCNTEGTKEEAVKYCPECDEYLCKTCTKYHLKMKATRDHKLVENEEGNQEQKIAKAISKIKCRQHPDRDIEMYCGTHDMVYCLMCIATEHRSCGDVTSLTDAAGSNFQQKEADCLQEEYECIKENLRVSEKKKQENLVSLEENKNRIETRLQEIAESLVEHIKLLHKQDKTQLNETYCNMKDELESDVKMLNSRISELEKVKDQFEATTEVNQETRFVRLKLNQQTMKDAQTLHAQFERADRVSINFAENTNVTEQLMEVKSLGKSNETRVKKRRKIKLQKEINVRMLNAGFKFRHAYSLKSSGNLE